MATNKQRLQIDQLENKFNQLNLVRAVSVPDKGWINLIRQALGLSLEQLGKKLNVSRQAINQYEVGEASGTITLNKLQQAADALEMKLVYALVPKDGSLEKLIEKRSRKVAEEIVSRTSTTMMLEDQENSPERLEKAIKEKTEELKRELPKYLWD